MYSLKKTMHSLLCLISIIMLAQSALAIKNRATLKPTAGLHNLTASTNNRINSNRNNGNTYFDTENNTVVHAQLGSKGLLPCIVHNGADGIVSWIRRKDYHLLTVGHTTYSSDERFQPVHYHNSQDWTLQIKYLQKRDAGIYECQLSSHPPLSIFIELDIVEAKAYIRGPTEKYIQPGSPLLLQCIILMSTEVPSYLFWYHNDHMINFESDLEFNVTTDYVLRKSNLYVPKALVSHSGNYSCLPDNAQSYSVNVNVFNGENLAAMQSTSSCVSKCLFAYLVTLSVSSYSLATHNRGHFK